MSDDETSAPDRATAPPRMVSRRLALGAMGTVAAAAGVAAATAPGQAKAQAGSTFVLPMPAPKAPPMAELVNLWQFEDQARVVIGAARLAPVAGSDRTVTDRMTLMPRINIPARDLDLTTSLFGDNHFTPIIVGPMANQKRFHPEGELATARGASKAYAGMVVSSASDVPLAQIAAATTQPLWVQVDGKAPGLRDAVAQAAAHKAKAVVVTINPAAPDWAAVDAVAKATSLPVIVKGVTTAQQAKDAVAHGAKGVVVSNWRAGAPANQPGTLLNVEPVVQAVGGQVPVLADGSFRYGSDVLKALALGAKAVMIGRPVMWGLAAYGADGVQGAVEFLQTDLARFSAMCGGTSIAAINRKMVRIHAPIPMARTA
jgi:isopentenyl diphosphate isomerase/L-lactate dehydrogenase-like FMN-dependent dehydrogenase